LTTVDLMWYNMVNVVILIIKQKICRTILISASKSAVLIEKYK